MKLLLFFVDGLGLGKSTENNPARHLLNGIADIPFTEDASPADFPGGILRSVDSTGGIAGLPQSATGQASLMTGINTSALLGQHLIALPNAILVNLIQEYSVMKTLHKFGISVTSSNFYTPEFFEHRQNLSQKRGRNMLPVSTLAIQASGASFRMAKEYAAGRALFADLSNRFLQERGYNIPLIDSEEAASRMVRILENSDFVFHEYFATDVYAHKQRHRELCRALDEIKCFLKALRARTNPEEVAILLISDHGNCEEPHSASHSLNPVPLLLLSTSPIAQKAFSGVTHLHEVKNGILAFFNIHPEDFVVENSTQWV